jgi:protein tyrosine phosphatase
MIWDKNCNIIVALNRLVENRTVKGDRYWPTEKTLKFDNLKVKLLGTLPLPNLDITIRRLKLIHNNTKRHIYHLHYEGWPDFGVPETSNAIRELVRYTLFYQKQHLPQRLSSAVPSYIVVHCSAGIGRSGSFMAITSIMSSPQFKQLMYPTTKPDKEKLLSLIADKFRIPEIVFSFRQKRHPGIVQTQQQYNFIYTALVDEICNPTTVSDGLKKLILFHSVKRREKRRFLSQSEPSLKSNRENYNNFLSDHTTNDLKYVFKRGRDQNNDRINYKMEHRQYKSSPMAAVMY